VVPLLRLPGSPTSILLEQDDDVGEVGVINIVIVANPRPGAMDSSSTASTSIFTAPLTRGRGKDSVARAQSAPSATRARCEGGGVAAVAPHLPVAERGR
jgi:hypothetical protein